MLLAMEAQRKSLAPCSGSTERESCSLQWKHREGVLAPCSGSTEKESMLPHLHHPCMLEFATP